MICFTLFYTLGVRCGEDISISIICVAIYWDFRGCIEGLFNAMAFCTICKGNWTFSFVGIVDCAKEQEWNYWCTRSALFQVANISTSSGQRDERKQNFNWIGLKRNVTETPFNIPPQYTELRPPTIYGGSSINIFFLHRWKLVLNGFL